MDPVARSLGIFGPTPAPPSRAARGGADKQRGTGSGAPGDAGQRGSRDMGARQWPWEWSQGSAGAGKREVGGG